MYCDSCSIIYHNNSTRNNLDVTFGRILYVPTRCQYVWASNIPVYHVYLGTVMTSFNYIVIPTHGNWFQTNPLKHESDDRAHNTVTSVCVTNGKDMALQQQIWSTFVHKTKIQDRARTLVLVRVLSYDFQY